MILSIAISLALTGARNSPWIRGRLFKHNPPSNLFAKYMPITLEEVESDVTEAVVRGATFVHIHARNPWTGAQFADLGWYNETAKRVREINPNLILSFPTSRKMEVGHQIERSLQRIERTQGNPPGKYDQAHEELKIRAVAIEAHPDTLTTFTVPEVKMLGALRDSTGVEHVHGWTDPEVMQIYYHSLIQRARELNVMQEVEITTIGQFEVLDKMAQSGQYHMDAPMHFVVLLGFSNGLPINKATYDTALKKIEKLRHGVEHPTIISVGAVIRPHEANPSSKTDAGGGKHDYHEVINWVAGDPRVSIFRVGLEDTPQLYDRQWRNPELVKDAVDYFGKKGVLVVTDPVLLRKHFGMSVNDSSQTSAEKEFPKVQSVPTFLSEAGNSRNSAMWMLFINLAKTGYGRFNDVEEFKFWNSIADFVLKNVSPPQNVEDIERYFREVHKNIGREFRMNSSYESLSNKNRLNTIMIALAGMGAHFRNDYKLNPTNEKVLIGRIANEVLWQLNYNEGGFNRQRLNREVVASCALDIISEFENGSNYLSNPDHFNEAMERFHREMRKGHSWHGVRFEDFYYMHSKLKDSAQIVQDTTTVVFLAAVVTHELFRDMEISKEELGLK